MVGRMFNPSMAEMASRLTTFGTWPNDVAVKPKDLAEAGFYYTSVSDTVCCFSCGERIDGWQIGDVPEERHRRLVFLRNCVVVNRHGHTGDWSR